jgi:hypothetical protein
MNLINCVAINTEHDALHADQQMFLLSHVWPQRQEIVHLRVTWYAMSQYGPIITLSQAKDRCLQDGTQFIRRYSLFKPKRQTIILPFSTIGISCATSFDWLRWSRLSGFFIRFNLILYNTSKTQKWSGTFRKFSFLIWIYSAQSTAPIWQCHIVMSFQVALSWGVQFHTNASR